MDSKAKPHRGKKPLPMAENNELFDRSTLRERRRQAIIRAAATAFNREGFHNTSMDELAAALNTSKPTLYQFFENSRSFCMPAISMRWITARRLSPSPIEMAELGVRSSRSSAVDICTASWMTSALVLF
jgi:hypothetical protein